MGLFAPNIEKMKAMRYVEGLIYALDDTDLNIREAAAQALCELGNPLAVKPLLDALKDSSPTRRKAAAAALEKICDGRPFQLLAYQSKEGGITAKPPAVAPEKAGDGDDADAFIAALGSGDGDTRLAAMQALGRRNEARAVGPLLDCLTDRRWIHRRTAAQALAKLYASKKLDPRSAQLILEKRGTLTVAHTDTSHQDSHTDIHHNREDFRDSGCIGDELPETSSHTDTPAKDYGIGIDFPL